MKGIRYLVDEHGEKIAAVVEFKELGELWEDFYDLALRSGHVLSQSPAMDHLSSPATGLVLWLTL